MSKKDMRRIEVDGKDYLWRIWHHDTWFGWGGWSATLRVYSTEYKNGWLEVRFEEEDRFPSNSVTYKWTGETGFAIHEPKTVVRIIRYALNQLNWIPEANRSPLVIESGYQLLKNLGYESDA